MKETKLPVEAKTWLYDAALGNALQDISDSSGRPDSDGFSAIELCVIPI
jgi:hypothetical protein